MLNWEAKQGKRKISKLRDLQSHLTFMAINLRHLILPTVLHDTPESLIIPLSLKQLFHSLPPSSNAVIVCLSPLECNLMRVEIFEDFECSCIPSSLKVPSIQCTLYIPLIGIDYPPFD